MAPLIAGFWTLAGDVSPFSASRVCAWSLEARIEAASAAGFRGIGFAHDDLMHHLRPTGAQALGRRLTNAGLDLVELELIVDWHATGPRRAASDVVRRNLLDVAAALGARHVKVVGDRDRAADWPLAELVDRFARLCDEARDAGTLVALEFQPWSAVHDLATAMPIVAGAAHPHGGLMVDAWHVDRGGIPLSDIAALPAGAVVAVELCDARREVVGTLWEDTSHRRMLCGEGELPLEGLLGALREHGYAGPFSVEIISQAHRALPLGEQARRAYRTTAEVLLRFTEVGI